MSEEARRQLLERIADGRLAPSTPLTELELARQLGVSRTPLHEAMVALARDGLVESLGQRGWRVLPLSDSDAGQIYPLIASLAALGLRLSGSLVLGALDDLGRLAELERDERLDSERLSAERAWQETMLAQCPNEVLKQMVRPLSFRAARYERAMADSGSRLPSELDSVVACLRRADVEAASKLLERHWLERGRKVAEWMRRAQAGSEDRGAPVPGAA